VERAQTGNAVPPAQLDVRWFKVHQPMVSLDLFTWLAPAGPFTAEEQRERDYAFGHLFQQLRRGLKRQETVALSTHLLEYLRPRQVLSLPEILPKGDEDDQEAPSGTQQETPSSPVQITFPASAVKRFFEAV